MAAAIKTIVVGFNGFERGETLPRLATLLAEEHGAALRVVHVAPEPPKDSWWRSNDEAIAAYQAELEAKRGRLEQLLATPEKHGLDATAVIRTGTPHVEIVREVLEADADLLLVADEPMRRRSGRGFATVTMKLLRTCPCPVLAKRDPRKYRHRSILAALDLGVGPDHAPEQNREILELAASLTKRADGTLTVFHAWYLWGEHLMSGRAGMSVDEVHQLVENTRLERERAAQAIIDNSDLAGVEPGLELVKGEARQLLPELVDRDKIDLVVMGTVCRTGLKGLLMGNTAERILNELSCSVLAIKPAGFQCPIEASSEQQH
ncbi:MAG: universal stress protein [Deltaproteobacteria bacterium]|nr:universal stress protein [Deltaproteobacteria bacterium]